MIYLDNNSTTKIDPRVLEKMLPFLTENYANSSSVHFFGKEIGKAVKNARNQVAEIINCNPNEITFTSGSTEAINIALKGVADSCKQKGRHIITTSTEHISVLETCKYLENIGFEITYLPVDVNGLLDIDLFRNSIRKNTILASVIFVNNETGVIQPIQQLSEIAQTNGILFMTDATQAVGKIPINLNDLEIDLMCFSGHKFHGPKGAGALYIRNKKVKLNPLIHGGGQEAGIRSGTINSPAIIGFGMASVIAKSEIESDIKRIREMKNFLESELLKIEFSYLNGHPTERIHNTSNICFRGLDADTLIAKTKQIAFSNGSACSSTSLEPSHVLKAMGLSKEDAFSSIRFSLGRFNTMEEIISASREITDSITSVRMIID